MEVSRKDVTNMEKKKKSIKVKDYSKGERERESVG